MSSVEDAIALAAHAHRGQRYSSVKLVDLQENLANNLRLPDAPGNADRIARYERALARLSDES